MPRATPRRVGAPGLIGPVRAPARTQDGVPGEARCPFVPGPREARRCEQMGRVPPRVHTRGLAHSLRWRMQPDPPPGGRSCSPPPRAPGPSPPECPLRRRPTEGGALTQHLLGHVDSFILFPYSLFLKQRNPFKALEVCMLSPPFAFFCFILFLHVFPLLRGAWGRRGASLTAPGSAR